MNNKLSDLNNHLFAEMERLGDEEITGELLEVEIERAKAISSISNQIISNANLQLNAVKLQCEYGIERDIGLKGLIGVNDGN